MTTRRHRVMQVRSSGEAVWRSDELTAEEPLEIRLNDEPISVTMRTPGADFDLAVGFLVTEGIIGAGDEIARMRKCPLAPGASGSYNVVEVTLKHEPAVKPPTRNFYTSSSCGICGKASIESVRTASRYDVRDDPLTVSPALLATLPVALRDAQKVFARTGGLHAAALFTAAGELVCVREDVGRHNAFDKVIGWAATQRLLPLTSHIILASGRASFELTQKALMAGIPLIAAVSAPSQLAVQLADEAGMTLIGFLRGDQMNVYSGHRRVLAGSHVAAGAAAVMNGVVPIE
jgi:FdhD protein